MNRMKLIGVAGALAAVVALGSPLAASAGLAYHSYNLTIYKLGGGDFSVEQQKVTSNKAGNLQVNFVGNNYAIGAAMVTPSLSQKGTSRYDLVAGDTTTLPNTISAGTDVVLRVWGNPFWPVDIQTTGIWRSN